MAVSKVIAVAALAALGLAACNNPNARGGVGGNRAAGGLCTPFTTAATTAAAPGATAQAAPLDASVAVDDCLHRWGYSLAPSSDPAEAVAAATVVACTPVLLRWNQQVMGGPAGAGGAPAASEAAPSLMTGEPTTPIMQHNIFAQSRALFYVVQARAGKCPPPPVAETTTTAPNRY